MASEITDKRVWTTLITNTAYLSGLLTLDHSLKLVKSEYRLVALYTDTFPVEGHAALDARGIPKLPIEYLLPTKSKDYSADPRFYDCWSKLQPFSLTQFDKIVQLDSDMVVLKNMDELFDLDLENVGDGKQGGKVFGASHACVCNPMEFEHYPKDWIPANCTFTEYHETSVTVSKEGEDESVVALGPQPGDTKLKICNGGLQLVAPNKEYHQAILNKLEDDSAASYEFADQSLLSDVFDSKWVGLSYIYNFLKTMVSVHPQLKIERVKNVHYILTPKPWNVVPVDEADNSKYEYRVENRPTDGKLFTDDTDTFKYWWNVNSDRLDREAERNINDGF
jgi:hypothetical protein